MSSAVCADKYRMRPCNGFRILAISTFRTKKEAEFHCWNGSPTPMQSPFSGLKSGCFAAPLKHFYIRQNTL